MDMRRSLILMLMCTIALTCVVFPDGAWATKNLVFRRWVLEMEAQNKIVPERKQDSVTVSNWKDDAIVTVRHRRGIGSVLLRLHRNPKLQRRWPPIRLRFKNFKGLEGLKVMNGERTISLHPEDSSLRGQHLDVQRKGKGFEVEVPAEFLTLKLPGSEMLQVEWVDFYR